MYECKLIFINAAIVFGGKRRQEGTSLICRRFFLSLEGFKTQIQLCQTASLTSVTGAEDVLRTLNMRQAYGNNLGLLRAAGRLYTQGWS